MARGNQKVNLPTVRESDTDKDDQEVQDSADRLSRARELMAANDDATQRARLPEGGGDAPVNVSPFIPAEAAGLPPAVQGQIASEAGAMASMLRANQVAARLRNSGVATMDSQGPEETTGGRVEPRKIGQVRQIVCPNCGRAWEYRMNLAGSTIPCSGCHFLVEVPYPDRLEFAPDAESADEARSGLAEAFPAPEKPKLDPEAAAEETEKEGGEKGDRE